MVQISSENEEFAFLYQFRHFDYSKFNKILIQGLSIIMDLRHICKYCELNFI